MGAWRLLQELVGWLNVLVALGGVVVCALNLKRSRWVGLLLGGFAVEALVSAFFRVASLLLGLAGGLSLAYAALSVLGLLGRLAIVGGLAGLLFEPRGGAPRPAA